MALGIRFALLASSLLLTSCAEKPASFELLGTRMVTLPDSARILAEVKITPQEMARGLMFRESLPHDRGMLFIHGTSGTYSYWMYQCKIPLDIIWMNSNRRVVEIAANTPPCEAKAADCPSYGGHQPSQFVLELGGGEAQRHGVVEGQTILF